MSWFKRFLRVSNERGKGEPEDGVGEERRDAREANASREPPPLQPSQAVARPEASEPPRVSPRLMSMYSRLLGDPEFVFLLLSTSSNAGSVRVKLPRDVYAAAMELGKSSLRLAGNAPAYLVVYGDGVTVRGLAYAGRLLGVYGEAGGKGLEGVEALQAVAEAGEAAVSVARITPRIAEWKPEYSVYVRSLDAQHKKFFEILNNMYEVIVTGRVEDEFEPVLRGLREYTRGHFKSEETIMEKYGYPEEEFRRHRAEHASFTRIVEGYGEEYEADPSSVNIRMFYVVRDWLREHILGSDKRYGEYFRRLGIKVE